MFAVNHVEAYFIHLELTLTNFNYVSDNVQRWNYSSACLENLKIFHHIKAGTKTFCKVFSQIQN